MNFINLLTSSFCMALTFWACGNNTDVDSDKPIDEDTPSSQTFAKGADISWVTEMEQKGLKFYNATGVETDCFQLMKDVGMNAIRLRVWVNPTEGWCGKADVLAKARRAVNLKMRLMIDFHYSDSWADPGKQNKPMAWKDMSMEQLKQAVASHTEDVLKVLKAENITPEWVQVGNETRNGMLWDDGKLWTEDGKQLDHWVQYAALSNAGYEAVKRIFPNATVIVHVDNGWDDNDWWFKKFRAAGGKWDMIGLSHYPQAYTASSWEEMNRLCLAHIRSLSTDYKCKVLICEVGTKQSDEMLAAKILSQFVAGAKEIPSCAGVFYWEPECSGWNNYDMGAFTSEGKPSVALDAFK